MPHPIRHLCVALLGLLALAAPAGAQKQRGDRNRLTPVDFAEGGSSLISAREVVRVLRAQSK